MHSEPSVPSNTTEEIIQEEAMQEVIEEVSQEVKYSDEITRLKNYYDREYEELVKNYLSKILTGDESEEELESLKARVGQQVKEAMLSQNPEYHVLVQKGLI